MRVLLTGTEGCGIDEAERLLRAAGHAVVSCHTDDPPAGACACEGEPGRCTAETDIDVIVVARKHPLPHIISRERITSCALLAGVPLVVVGSTACNPFGTRATACVEGIDKVVDACEWVTARTTPPEVVEEPAAPSEPVLGALARVLVSGR